jgi:SAM-dependent methyltransferase
MKTGAHTYSEAMLDAVNYSRWVIGAFKSDYGRCILEVGLGHGGFRPYFPNDRAYIGLDIDADVVAGANERYPGDAIIQGDVMDPRLLDTLRPYGIDTVFCANVLEHIEDDRAAVENMLGLLPPGGRLLVFAPAHPSLYNDMDRLAGHHRRYSRSGLVNLMPNRRAVIKRIHYFNPLGGFGWWMNRFSHPKSLDDPSINRQVRFFDRYVLPLSRLLNPLTAGVFGQSIACVVEKK